MRYCFVRLITFIRYFIFRKAFNRFTAVPLYWIQWEGMQNTAMRPQSFPLKTPVVFRIRIQSYRASVAVWITYCLLRRHF
jgi:hypothetical protein